MSKPDCGDPALGTDWCTRPEGHSGDHVNARPPSPNAAPFWAMRENPQWGAYVRRRWPQEVDAA